MDAQRMKIQLGKAIARERTAQGLSQRQLALMSGTTQTHISKIERAEIDVRIVSLLLISDALGIDVRDFFSC